MCSGNSRHRGAACSGHRPGLSGWAYCTAERMCVRKVGSGRAARGLVARVWISDFKFKEKPLEILNGNGMLRLHI